MLSAAMAIYSSARQFASSPLPERGFDGIQRQFELVVRQELLKLGDLIRAHAFGSFREVGSRLAKILRGLAPLRVESAISQHARSL